MAPGSSATLGSVSVAQNLWRLEVIRLKYEGDLGTIGLMLDLHGIEMAGNRVGGSNWSTSLLDRDERKCVGTHMSWGVSLGLH